MPATIHQLYEQLQLQLGTIRSEEPGLLQQSTRCIEACRDAIQQVKLYIKEHPFPDKAAEIHFFKTEQPLFFSQLIFYVKVFQLESNRPAGGTGAERKFFQQQLDRLQFFFENNQEFYKYYRTGATHLDELYFLRGRYDLRLLPDDKVLALDPDGCTLQSLMVAKVLAHELLVDHIHGILVSLEQVYSPAPSPGLPTLQWTGSKVALIELIYAIQSARVLNNGQADIKLLTHFFESIFNLQLGNVYHVFQEMRLRKKGRTSFLDQLREQLVQRMDLADER